MDITNIKNGIRIKKPDFFDVQRTLNCGQCFRWETTHNISKGVVFGKVIEIIEEDATFDILNTDTKEFNSSLKNYFGLNTNYSEIISNLQNDQVLKVAIQSAHGIRILEQSFFETLISFIISQQNSIPKIKKQVHRFCQEFGNKIIYNGEAFYTFPNACDLKDLKQSDLAFLRCGYRDHYLIDAIKKVHDGEINVDALHKLDTLSAKKELLKIKGVGDKVADCVLLFSLKRFDAFPKDTWIKKAMTGLYQINVDEIEDFSKKHFGEISGIAQQYLFYYIRNVLNKAV